MGVGWGCQRQVRKQRKRSKQEVRGNSRILLGSESFDTSGGVAAMGYGVLAGDL